MKKFFSALLAVLLLVGIMGTAGAVSSFYVPGMVVEDFTVTLQDGTAANLHTLLQTKKAVVINIWATWCGPCRMEFPYMNRAYDMYKDDIALLCLSPFDSNEDITAFMQSNGLTLPMGFDSAGLGDRFVMEGYPTTVVIDQTDTCIYYECGAMLSTFQFTRLFDAILNEGRVPGELLVIPPVDDAALSVFPRTLNGTELALTVISPSARQVIISDPSGVVDAYFPNERFFLVPEDTVTVRAEIGNAVDPTSAFMAGDYDQVYHMLCECVNGDAYEAEIPLDSIRKGGYSSTFILLFDSMEGDLSNFVRLVVFKSEDDLNYFCHDEITLRYGDPADPCTWAYADGGEASYTIRVVDEQGLPVTGVMVNVCTEETCAPAMVDADGVYAFMSEPCVYAIHVLTAPEGYAFDAGAEYSLPASGGEVVIPLQHK